MSDNDLNKPGHSNPPSTRSEPAASPSGAENPAAQPYTVLHLDDDDMLRTTTAQLLEIFKFEVRSFGSYDEMQPSLQGDEQWHVAILDKLMPDIDGLDVAKMIRNLGFSQPLVLMTGNHSDTLRQQCAQIGGVHLIGKPIRSRELAETLNSLCEEYAAGLTSN